MAYEWKFPQTAPTGAATTLGLSREGNRRRTRDE